MRLPLFSLYLLFLFGLGCVSTPLGEESSHLERLRDRAHGYRLEYLKAKDLIAKEPSLACDLFSALAEAYDYVLRDVAYLYGLRVCDEKHIQSLNLQSRSISPWLLSLKLEVDLERAEKAGDVPAQIEALYQLAKRSAISSEKVERVQKAMGLAEAHGHSNTYMELDEYLKRIAPRFRKDPAFEELVDVALDFSRVRDFNKSISLLRSVIRANKGGWDYQRRAYRALKAVYKNARDHEAHIRISMQEARYLNFEWVKSHPRIGRRSKALKQALYDSRLGWARAVWTQGRPQEALKILDETERKLSRVQSISELYWVRGRIFEERKQFDLASLEFEKAFSDLKRERRSRTDLEDRLHWSRAWTLRKLGDLERAALAFADGIDNASNEFHRFRMMYWKGQTLAEIERKDEAENLFETLIVEDSVGYYGIMAHRALNRPLRWVGGRDLASEDHALSLSIQALPALEKLVVTELIEVKEFDLATQLLDEVSDRLLGEPSVPADIWVDVFQLYARAQSYLKLFEKLGQVDSELRRKILATRPELIFPRLHEDLIRTVSTAPPVDEALVLSVIRQESAFNARARSWADAFGLMQVLPEVAHRSPLREKVGYSQFEDLYRPEVNIPIGADFLRSLFERYKNQFILAVAAYNANERAIRNWLKTRFTGNVLEFIEDIPYEETRGYVRLILRNYIFYSLLLSPQEELKFPEDLLRIEDS